METDDFNRHDIYSVAVQDDGLNCWPQEISKICYFFLKNNGSIEGKLLDAGKNPKYTIKV